MERDHHRIRVSENFAYPEGLKNGTCLLKTWFYRFIGGYPGRGDGA